MTEMKKAGLDRRSVIKGAAWSVPVVAAAVASPVALAATSGGEVPDTCAGCFKPGNIVAGSLGGGVIASVVAGNKGALAMVNTVGINSNGGDCKFNILTGVAYAAVITQSKLTWRNNKTNTVTTRSSFITGGASTGVVGTSLGVSALASTFTNLDFPAGLYAGSNPPAEPTRICFEVNFTIQAGAIPIPNATDISCTEDLCWDMSMQALGVVGAITGTGTVEYIGLDFTPVV